MIIKSTLKPLIKKASMGIEKQYQELFSSNKFKEAIELLKAHKSEFEPSVYHFNQGVNYAKAGELAQARFHLEMAKGEGLYSPELRASLEQVKLASGAATLEETSSLKDYALDYALQTSVVTGLNITLALLLALVFFRKKIAPTWAKTCLALLCLAPVGSQYLIKTSYTRAVAMNKKEVFTGPSQIFEVKQEIVPGMVLILTQEEGPWRQIVSPWSHKGWARAGEFEEL